MVLWNVSEVCWLLRRRERWPLGVNNIIKQLIGAIIQRHFKLNSWIKATESHYQTGKWRKAFFCCQHKRTFDWPLMTSNLHAVQETHAFVDTIIISPISMSFFFQFDSSEGPLIEHRRKWTWNHPHSLVYRWPISSYSSSVACMNTSRIYRSIKEKMIDVTK